jgi:hypothetical protein
MEDDLRFFCKMEDNLNLLANGRQHQFVCKWKTTSFFCLCKTTSVSYSVKLAQLALASPELGTTQPQLVFVFEIEI